MSTESPNNSVLDEIRIGQHGQVPLIQQSTVAYVSKIVFAELDKLCIAGRRFVLVDDSSQALLVAIQ